MLVYATCFFRETCDVRVLESYVGVADRKYWGSGWDFG